MVEANASMYLGSPRMAQEVISEDATLEEMGGARMHATVSGCGDNLVTDDDEAIDAAKRWLSYLPQSWQDGTLRVPPRAVRSGAKPIDTVVPVEERRAYDMHKVIDAVVDEDSFFEV